MPKTKKNVNYTQNKNKNIKIEVAGSVPTYSDLNAFMRPSKISPLYVDDHDKSSESDDEFSSDDSQISESLYDVGVDTDDETDINPALSVSVPTNEYGNDIDTDVDIAQNDTNIYNMKCILEKKRQLLLHKNREIKELAKQNVFLNNVLSDYEKIKSRILEEKQKQQAAIKIISKHISQISKNMNKEDYHINQLQDDQSYLLEELEKIKMEMNEVMRS